MTANILVVNVEIIGLSDLLQHRFGEAAEEGTPAVLLGRVRRAHRGGSSLNTGGRRVGLWAFRPERGGPFGRFQVSGWENGK